MSEARRDRPEIGIACALVCLAILGVMPIIANSRPSDFDALSFAFFLSVWQLLFSTPLVLGEFVAGNRGVFAAELAPRLKRRTIVIILLTGAIFGLSTYVYVLAVEKAGAVSAAIAMQAYPLFAILWEALFLKRMKSALEMTFTALLLAVLYYLATGGTWWITGFSPWFTLALAVPFLWSVAHVIIKEVLDRTPITPAQVTFLRVLVSAVFLSAILIAIDGPQRIVDGLGNRDFQTFALIMGLVYYLELIFWFYAVRYIAVSTASSITVPWPALTMVLAVLFLDETVAPYQIVALICVVTTLYALIDAGKRRRRQA